MTTGTIFDIREFTVHDGPGIRTTVFLKGCPLRCAWCHNPEGFVRQPQTMVTPAGRRVVGQDMSAEELAGILNRQAEVLAANEGGVTFSGGEPLTQAEFLVAVIDRLEGIHVLLDTSGCADAHDFRSIVQRCDLVFFDLKLMDPALHRHFTGQDNGPILANLRQLAGLGVPYVVRVPLVPGITDTEANLTAIAEAIRSLSGLVGVNLLAYNRAAGGKYPGLGMTFEPTWDETQPVNASLAPFVAVGLDATVLGLRDHEGK
ncbi:MAG: radical SAM protein [Sedimentisphaerales bacterium]|nr:radical SAM protein [Sedimentisphaerales bacterium]